VKAVDQTSDATDTDGNITCSMEEVIWFIDIICGGCTTPCEGFAFAFGEWGQDWFAEQC
jgi:hypothetical protein